MPSWQAVEAATDPLARARQIQRSWDRRDRDARLRRRAGDLTSPLDIPGNGGETAMGDGSLRTSVGEQLSQVEAEPILFCGAPRDISAAEQAENRLREVAEE